MDEIIASMSIQAIMTEEIIQFSLDRAIQSDGIPETVRHTDNNSIDIAINDNINTVKRRKKRER